MAREWRRIPLLFIPILLSLYPYYDYRTLLHSLITGSDPIWRIFESNLWPSPSPIELILFKSIDPAIVYAFSGALVSYALLRGLDTRLLPGYSLLLLMGDPLTPLLHIAMNLGRRASVIGLAGLIIHSPIAVIGLILLGILPRRALIPSLASIVLQYERYYTALVNPTPQGILLGILVVTLLLYMDRRPGPWLLTPIYPEASIAYRPGDRGGRTAPIIIAMVITGLIIIQLPINPGLNGGLDEFIASSIRDDAVLLLSDDPTLVAALQGMGIYTYLYGDAMDWNWSDREEIEKRLWDAIWTMMRFGYRYIVLEKPEELAYWISPAHFNEYKYPVREDTTRYIIILERRGLPGGAPHYMVTDFTPVTSLERFYDWTWSNVSIDVEVSGEWITISSDRAYEAYIHLNNVSSYSGLIFMAGDGPVESIEVYSLKDGVLNSLWESGRLLSGIVVPLELDLSSVETLVFKVEAKGDRAIKLGLYGGGELLEVEREGGIVRVSPNEGLREVRYRPIDGSPEDGGKLGLNIQLLSLILVLAAPFIPIERYYILGSPLKLDTRELMLFIVLGPALLYIAIPDMLEVSWIGAGVFVIALTMYILNYIDEEGLGETGHTTILALMPLASLLTYLVKLQYGDVFDLIGDFWRNRALYATIDAGIYSVFLTLTAIYIGGWRMRILAPGLYLGLSTVAFITDLSRSSNPVLQAVLEANVYLVDLTMELLGYRVEYVYTTLGYPLYLFEGTRLLTVVILAWPCAGVTGLFLFTGYVSTLRDIYLRSREPISWLAVAAGLLGTFLLNIARVDAILLLQIFYGVDAAELFHSTAYEFIFLAWLAIYWLIYRMLRR